MRLSVRRRQGQELVKLLHGGRLRPPWSADRDHAVSAGLAMSAMPGAKMRAAVETAACRLRQGGGQLSDFDRLKRFSQNKQFVGVMESMKDVFPIMIGVGRANDHLQMRVEAPEVLDRFYPIPAWWHAHIHECH